MRRDIDDALRGWPSDPEPGEVMAREVRARDGRTVLQLRIELGLLQMEVDGRPDGKRPLGFATYLDYLRDRAGSRRRRRRRGDGQDGSWKMSADQCAEVDREFLQFYHRRIAWLALQRFDRAVKDADHTLALMDFIGRYAPVPEYIAQHERFRGVVLFHRAQASAAMALERSRPEEAVDAIREGIDRLSGHQRAWERGPDIPGPGLDLDLDLDLDEEPGLELGHDEALAGGEAPMTPDGSLIEQLHQLEREIRRNFEVPKTLREQLDEAVAQEDYERAARLRDQIRARAR